MIYELLLNDIREVPKDTLKKISLELDDRFRKEINAIIADIMLNDKVDVNSLKNLIKLEKDRTFYEMLLVNALKEDE